MQTIRMMHDTTVLSVTEEREEGKYRALAESGNFPGNDAEGVCTACQKVSEVK